MAPTEVTALWDRVRAYVRAFMDEWESLSIGREDQVGLLRPDGDTITVDADGTIHGNTRYELPVATQSTLGGVMPDGTTTGTDQSGHISVIGPHLELRRDTDNRLRVAIVMEAQ